MKLRKRKYKKINLLEVPEVERSKILREVKEKLREKIIEEKLMRFLMESELLLINGEIVYRSNDPLMGFTLNELP